MAGLARAIASHETAGLDAAAPAGAPGSVAEHARVFGPNKYKAVPAKNFFALCWENIQDPIILILIAAALVRRMRRDAGAVCMCPPAAPTPCSCAPRAPACSPRAWPARTQYGPHARRAAAAAAMACTFARARAAHLLAPARRRSPRCWASRWRSSAMRASGLRASPSGWPCSSSLPWVRRGGRPQPAHSCRLASAYVRTPHGSPTTHPYLIPHTSAGAGNDYQKDLQFRKLNAVKDIIGIKVIRGGQVTVRASARGGTAHGHSPHRAANQGRRRLPRAPPP